jgi:hypothetical protein
MKKEEKITKKEQVATEGLNNTILLVLTIGLAAIYYVFSTFSDGFYMHDEVGNFMGAQQIWHDDVLSIVRANSKAGYKLLYAIPAIGGFAFLKIFNSVFAAFIVFFSYKLLVKFKSKNSLLIFFVLGIQPLWFMLVFRNYSEFLIALFLVLSALSFLNKKYIIASLLMSYVAFTRSEYHLLLGMLFFVLIYKKQWIPAILTGTFTVLQNLIGFIKTGDILYLPHVMMEYSERIKGAYPKQEISHYFLMSNVVFGSLAIILFVTYVGIMILKKKKPNWMLLVPVVVIFLVNVWFAHSVGGGNLRYLVTASPFLAILGVLAVDEIIGYKKKYLLLLFLIPILILIGMYQTFNHNFVHLDEVENWKPLLFALATVVLIVLPLKQKHYVITLSLIAVFIGATSITTRRIQPEEQTVKKAAKWYANHIKMANNPNTNQEQLFTENGKIVCGHALFFYYLDKNKYDFDKEPVMAVTKEATDTLQVGDLVIWDSHYGYRPKLRKTSQPYEFYLNNPQFQRIQYYQSKDGRFTIVFFRKVKD